MSEGYVVMMHGHWLGSDLCSGWSTLFEFGDWVSPIFKTRDIAKEFIRKVFINDEFWYSDCAMFEPDSDYMNDEWDGDGHHAPKIVEVDVPDNHICDTELELDNGSRLMYFVPTQILNAIASM